MRIAIASDLHLEHDVDLIRRAQAQAAQGASGGVAVNWWRHLNARASVPGHPLYGPDLDSAKGSDLCVLAGDIWSGIDSVTYANVVAQYLKCPVVLVAGNHEAYGLDWLSMIPAMRQAATDAHCRVSFLNDDRIDFRIGTKSVAVLGATLWTDYDLLMTADESMRQAFFGLNDHNRIAYGRNYFHHTHALAMHRRSRAWLASETPKARAEADLLIVVTHHGVLPESNPPEYRGGGLSPAFASDLTADITGWQADMVVSGHTHSPLDIRIGRTRVLSAPRGYVGTEPNVENFVPLVVEL